MSDEVDEIDEIEEIDDKVVEAIEELTEEDVQSSQLVLKKVLDLGQRKRLEMYQNAVGNLEYSEPSDPRITLMYLNIFMRIYGAVFASGSRTLVGMDRDMLDNLYAEVFEILTDLRFVIQTMRRLAYNPYNPLNYYSLQMVEQLMQKYRVKDGSIIGLLYQLERRALALAPIIDHLLADVLASYAENVSGEGRFVSFRSLGGGVPV